MRLFDLHCDTLTACYNEKQSLCRNELHLDLKRGREYRPWCQMFAVFVPDTLRGFSAYHYARKVLEFAHKQEKAYPQQLVLATHREALQKAVEADRCVGLLSVENGAALNGKLENVLHFFKQGVRSITLTWNGSNELGHGCLSPCGDGLTSFGRKAVREMVRYGMVPDVSHLNETGFWDVATLIDVPFIASHSVSRTVCEHPRNLTDAQFKELCRRGGLVGLTLDTAQVGGASFEDLYRHIVHFCELDGEAVLALGGDLDGTTLPNEWQGMAVYAALEEILLQKGLKAQFVERLFFQNAFDFFCNTLQGAENEVQ